MTRRTKTRVNARPDPAPPRLTVTPAVSARPLVVLPIISGVLLWLSFQSAWFSWLILVALAPLSLLVRLQGRFRWMYFGAWLGGLAFFLPALAWMRLAHPNVVWGWLLMSAYLAAYFPLYVLMARVLYRVWKLPALFAIPVAWITCEYLRMHLLSGFGWLMLAHAAWQWTWTIQLADLAGIYGVSFLIALINGALIEVLTQPLANQAGDRLVWDPTRRLRWRLGLTAGAIVAAWVYGWHRVSETESTTRDGPTIALVQTDLSQDIRNTDFEGARAIMLRAAKSDQTPVDLKIWPETSYLGTWFGEVDPNLTGAEVYDAIVKQIPDANPPANPAQKEAMGNDWRDFILSRRRALGDEIRKLNQTTLVGLGNNAVRRDRLHQFNASALVAPAAGVVQVYDKIHLVPFGEYLPLQNWLPFLRMLMPFGPDEHFGLDAATEFRTFHFENLNFASLICFEDTLPHLARQFFLRAAPDQPIEFLVNQSNDGWFRGSPEPQLHLIASLFRCIEHRVPLARVSNTGVTAVIDTAGRVIQRLPEMTEGTLHANLRLDSRRTMYRALGDWLPQLCGLMVAAAFLLTAAMIGRRVRERLEQRLSATK